MQPDRDLNPGPPHSVRTLYRLSYPARLHIVLYLVNINPCYIFLTLVKLAPNVGRQCNQGEKICSQTGTRTRDLRIPCERSTD
ncbi:hypothetical protein DPMN_013054 [Dreissena polymorpha]|uniref:Uncharacterized protein n=1 Tax=Dreissena polymorpha TaxID=45954 RepID=A0A9D4N3L2_DREPO|nr:hypothetical protein DPMN_013054 [Dreissena polymorpha]